MKGHSHAGYVTLVDRKPFTELPGLMLRIAYTPFHHTGPLEECTGTKPFEAVLDTGFSDEGIITFEVRNLNTALTAKYDALPDRNYLGAQGTPFTTRVCPSTLWIYPDGERPEAPSPLRVRLGEGVAIHRPGVQADAVVGLGALRRAKVRVHIDFRNALFSIFAPA